jgi:hypothetical protein
MRKAQVFLPLTIVLTMGACLTRPVVSNEPTTTLSVTIVQKQKAIDKIDLLFAIDNSESMGDKQAILKAAVPDLLGRLLNPNCVDAHDNVVGKSDAKGACEKGKAEFLPVTDVHIGIVSSSLGARGGDRCRDDEGHGNDRGHLLRRGGGDAHAVAATEPAGFLTWLPGGDPATLRGDFQDLVTGVDEDGCGYEGQLESVYRFLMQPDPYQDIVRDGSVAKLVGIDEELLRQRKAFLRPDSLLAVIMLTDENESTVDPLAASGQAWRYVDSHHVKGGTAKCAQAPMDPDCLSCFQQAAGGRPECATELGNDADEANVRFFHMKERFGFDPRFPIERYVRGFHETTVPDREGEHPNGSFSYAGDDQHSTCTNPIFAAELPDGAKDDLCKLPLGTRDPGQVFFALIGGVPWQLLTEEPQNMTAQNRAPFKAALDEVDWQRILGRAPERYDFTGIDPHMRESIEPRKDVGTDDVHGREWNPPHNDLQYACTFELPTPKDCTKEPCDCKTPSDSPLCADDPKTTQLRAKAYPTVQQLRVAKDLGTQGIVASLCPREIRESETENPDYGYRPAMKAIVDRLKSVLKSSCLPQSLEVDPQKGTVACVVLQTLPRPGDPKVVCDPAKGLKPLDPRVVIEREGADRDLPACELHQFSQSELVNGTCDDLGSFGWCYVQGAAAEGCAQSIRFSGPLRETDDIRLHLACVEQAPPFSAR